MLGMGRGDDTARKPQSDCSRSSPIRLAPSAFAGIHVFFEMATASQITYAK
jgi:hypothetical protein